MSGFSYRVFPQAGVDWRLPLARKVGRLTQIVEPIVSVILAPDGKNTDRMPNEDSVSFEFDDTSLFPGTGSAALTVSKADRALTMV